MLLFGWLVLHTHERLYSMAIAALILCYYNSFERFTWPCRATCLLVYCSGGLGRYRPQAAAAGRDSRLYNLFLAGAYVRHGWIPKLHENGSGYTYPIC